MITLGANDLCSKWGFGDGDILDSFFYDNDLDIKHAHAVLIRLVKKYLVPVLPPNIEVYEIGSIHNPIRATEQSQLVLEQLSQAVIITDDQIFQAYAEVRMGL